MEAGKQKRETARTLVKFVGQKFGRLTVLELVIVDGKSRFLCKCDCGQTIQARPHTLRASKRPTRSCGCLQREVVALRGFKHGHAGRGKQTREHQAWVNMNTRCIDPKQVGWKNYGGRGIYVCNHWKHSFEQFFADMGPRPEGKSLDRRNNDLSYLCPKCLPPIGNCKWSTRKEQAENRRKDAYPEIGKKNAAIWANRSEEYKAAWAANASARRRTVVARDHARLVEALLGAD